MSICLLHLDYCTVKNFTRLLQEKTDSRRGILVYIKLWPISHICLFPYDRNTSCCADGSALSRLALSNHIWSRKLNKLMSKPPLSLWCSAMTTSLMCWACFTRFGWPPQPTPPPPGSGYQCCKQTSVECAQACYHLLCSSSVVTWQVQYKCVCVCACLYSHKYWCVWERSAFGKTW